MNAVGRNISKGKSMAAALHYPHTEVGLEHSGGSIRKVKTDKADAMKIAKYALDNRMDLRE